VLALRGYPVPETLLISAHGMRRGRQQLGMVVLRSKSWSKNARDTWETADVREQIAQHFFLGAMVARVFLRRLWPQAHGGVVRTWEKG
jgi:hypothetical protein